MWLEDFIVWLADVTIWMAGDTVWLAGVIVWLSVLVGEGVGRVGSASVGLGLRGGVEGGVVEEWTTCGC